MPPIITILWGSASSQGGGCHGFSEFQLSRPVLFPGASPGQKVGSDAERLARNCESSLHIHEDGTFDLLRRTTPASRLL